MRKLSANLILPVSSPPLRNGIIFVNPDGSIADLIDTGGNLREESGLEFYPGTITPGFILPWFRLDDYSKSRTNSTSTIPSDRPETKSGLDNLSLSDNTTRLKNLNLTDKKVLPENPDLLENLVLELIKNGIKGIGLVLPETMVSIGGFELMSKSSLFFHPVIELCPGRDEDEFEVFNRGIDLVSHAWNEFNLSCSLTACSHAMEYSDIGKFIDEYGRSHKNMGFPEEKLVPPKGDLVPPKGDLVPPKGDSVLPDGKLVPSNGDLVSLKGDLPGDENPFNLLKKSITVNSGMNFEDLISSLTLDAAVQIFEENELGKIEKGRKPGLNLVSGYSAFDSGGMNENLSLKVLV